MGLRFTDALLMIISFFANWNLPVGPFFFLLSGATTLCHHASSRCHRQTSQRNNGLQLVVMPGTNTATGKERKKIGVHRGVLVEQEWPYKESTPCLTEQCHSVPAGLTHRGVKVELALPLIYEPSPRGRAAIALHLTVFKWPHQHTDNQWDKEERPACQPREGVWRGWTGGHIGKKGGMYISWGWWAFATLSVCQCLIATCL